MLPVHVANLSKFHSVGYNYWALFGTRGLLRNMSDVAQPKGLMKFGKHIHLCSAPPPNLISQVGQQAKIPSH